MQMKENPSKAQMCCSGAERGVSKHNAVDTFGSEIYRLRLVRGLSQSATAERSGLTRGYYSQLENSKKTPPPLSTLERLASALSLSPIEIAHLKHLAEVERRGIVHFPREMPANIAKVLRQLALKAHLLSPAQLRELDSILAEDQNL